MSKNKVHYDPYCDGEAPDIAECGTLPPEDEYLYSGDWSFVTCSRCIKKKDKLTNSYNKTEGDIVNQMGNMAEFFKEKRR